MSRPKIKTVLASIMVGLALAFVMFAGFALNRLSAINENVSQIYQDNMPTLDAVKDMQVQLAEMRVAYRSHILRSDAEGKANAAKSIETAIASLKKDEAAYRALGPIDEEARLIDGFDKSLAEYTAAGTKVLEFSTAGKLDEANDILRNVMAKTSDAARAALDRMLELSRVTAAEAFAEAGQAYDRTFTVAIVSVVALMLAIVGAIWFALSGIAKPIENITQSMKNLAGGDAESAIPYPGRQDEIGEMAAAVGVFRSNALDNRRLEQETSAQRHQSEEQQRRAAEQDRVRAEAMAQATSGLADGLKQLSAGNLSFQLSQPFAADFESLRADFNTAVEQLRGTLGAVSQATSSIDSGSREVSQSADDLAKRTEQQAASLEQTAAALDEITANVSNSSKRAEEARTVAIQANESARHSGAVVANAVDAMGKIEQSSSQISSIISVIDEIAFQTNLLALNAGVEAARAGEAGKGFAVVAQEVRELAQRSAKAAKEIKDLIRNSSVDVESGVKLVSETGDALKTIEGYIVTINQHMDSIATSAREQSVGLSEVNTAVNQMDQVTQQNAAMVEEANAAGATLANEAARLRELIGRFDLGAGASLSQSNQLRRTAQVMAASPQSRPAASPARSMVGKIAQAFTGRSSAAAAPSAAADSWEEF
ncbi:methyl-accepting chemotaxis protein [Rhizobium deserti]|uniref:Methyl-accepting chemotaxis protein n=1 Tax=Rhizobium deserti TaxID=2547961 RepID=A0A4R5UKC2_9HYPH|nr:HAMP domain-containing methyl-accepting chemotaxis protein [Rhizobium deserti]TDK37347.1 methyl-accepting chemotaxis protein [Rhizobium deserti]